MEHIAAAVNVDQKPFRVSRRNDLGGHRNARAPPTVVRSNLTRGARTDPEARFGVAAAESTKDFQSSAVAGPLLPDRIQTAPRSAPAFRG